MENVLLVMHLIITLFLIIVVLMQRSEGGGIGLGTASSTGGLVSVRGTTNFMTKLTSWLAALFIIISLALAVMASQGSSNKSLIDKLEDSSNDLPVIEIPTDPVAPLSE